MGYSPWGHRESDTSEQLTYTTSKGGWVSIQRPTLPRLSPLPENQWARAFIDRERGLHAETAQSVLTVILKLVIDGLTGVILTALGIVSLKFQHLFVSIFLRPVLGMMAVYVQLQSSHNIVNFSTRHFNIYKTTHRIQLGILSVALKEELKAPDCLMGTSLLFGLI